MSAYVIQLKVCHSDGYTVIFQGKAELVPVIETLKLQVESNTKGTGT